MNRIRGVLVASVLAFGLRTGYAQNNLSRQLISPQEAVESVRRFMGVADLNVAVGKVEVNSDLLHYGDTGGYGTHYVLEKYLGGGAYNGFYCVNAHNGDVIGFDLSGYAEPTDSQDSVANFTPERGQTIAEEFLKRHYPFFARGRCVRDTNPNLNSFWMYTYLWAPVVNEQYGTLGPYGIYVKVDGLRGKVVGYKVPRTMEINAPTVPRISLDQARRIAARYATYDPAKVPLIHPILRVGEDAYGVYYLSWKFYQVLDPKDEATIMEGGFTAEVDAITGAGRPSPGQYGMPTDTKLANKNRAASPVYTGVVIQTSNRKRLASAAAPEILDGSVWIRAEILRGIGAQVQVSPKVLTVDCEGKELNARALSAKWRGNGWWLQLRAVQTAMGIHVDWVPEKKTAIIDRPLAELRLPGTNGATHF